jgi:hypothetical protein
MFGMTAASSHTACQELAPGLATPPLQILVAALCWLSMPDERRRDLERAAFLDPTVEAAALRQRVRLGGDDAERVRLAAALGHAAARDAVGSREHGHLLGEWRAATRDLLARTLLSGAPPSPLSPPGAAPARPAPEILDPDARTAVRDLHGALLDGDLDDDGEVALEAWLAANPDVRVVAEPLRRVGSSATHEELWTLFAFGRAFDFLLCAIAGPLALQRLMASVGLDAFVHPLFHPLLHELTGVVEADDPDEPPALLDVTWPGARFGDLVVVRSGVVVRAGRSWLDPAAATSPIYFVNRRRDRLAHDMSHGSGSNSQWGTSLRRDYVTPDAALCNVDGSVPLEAGMADDASDDLTVEERRELLAHRSFVRAPRVRDADERYPFRWSLTLRRDALPSDSRVALEVARGSGWCPLRP